MGERVQLLLHLAVVPLFALLFSFGLGGGGEEGRERGRWRGVYQQLLLELVQLVELDRLRFLLLRSLLLLVHLLGFVWMLFVEVVYGELVRRGLHALVGMEMRRWRLLGDVVGGPVRDYGEGIVENDGGGWDGLFLVLNLVYGMGGRKRWRNGCPFLQIYDNNINILMLGWEANSI